jgi:hypothetical protein
MKINRNRRHPTFIIQRPSRVMGGDRPGSRGAKLRWAAFLCPALFDTHLFAQSTTNGLPPLAPAYPEMPPPFWELHESTIVVGSLALLAAATLYLLARLRPATTEIVPPGILAHAALVRLQRQPEDGNVLSEISQALRRYVSAAFALPAGELTTAELSAALADNANVGRELAQGVCGLLRECDERKFSPAVPSVPLNAATRAFEIVAQLEKRRMQFEPEEIR